MINQHEKRVSERSVQEIVIAAYSDPEVLRVYRRLGLIKAEEVLIRQYFPRGARVLDIGCGSGRTSIPLSSRAIGLLRSTSPLQ